MEKDPKYIVDMGHWHQPTNNHNNKCMVCLAGSIMAKSLKISPKINFPPSFCNSEQNYNALVALNHFRSGCISSGLSKMGIKNIEKKLNPRSYLREIVDYHNDPVKFKKQMIKLADFLEKKGL